ncbi:MAG: DsbA family oxidoreductase [Alphaproteobacteria bacterium]|nr:DsbA family oxidoreductase [Alphaproteobacteria bacterium]
MRIDIFSDVICPWCFIGKRRLERALADRPRPVDIRWRAFLLNRDMPPEGMERQEYLTLKFGGDAKARDLYGSIEQVGAGEGIPFAFDCIRRTPNTIQAHRVVHFAGEVGQQDAVVEALFRAYFLDGRDLSDDRVLSTVATEAGLDEVAVSAMLAGGDGADLVLAENDLAHEIGINGVPCFIVAERYAISGAQGSEVFSRLLDSLEQIDQGGELRR